MRVSFLSRAMLATGLSLAGIATCDAQQTGSDAQPENKNQTIQIEIVKQDGGKVEAIAPATDPEEKSGPIRVEATDGKITIVGPDGKKRQLDLQGAASVVVNQSVQSVDDNGDQKIRRSGKMIIVGPDGKREVVDLQNLQGDLNLQLPELNLNMPPRNGVFRFVPADGAFVIGVFCEPVSDALASQLRLPSGTGLLVTDVGSDSAADQAGLETYDVLLYAGQEALASQEDLVTAVQQAGKEQNAISLTIIRGGKESTLEIQPTKRSADAVLPQPGDQLKLKLLPNFDEQGKFEFRFVEPGAILNGPLEIQPPDNLPRQQDLEAQMQRVEEQLRKMRERMEQEFQKRGLRDDG